VIWAQYFFGGVAQAVAHQVDHAGLHGGLGPGRHDRLGKTLQAVAAHDAHAEDATIPQVGQHVHPLLGTFPGGRANPQA